MQKNRPLLLATVLLALPISVLAHTGQGDHGFIDGFAHPFLGIDHLIAMLVVGVWSVLHARHIWLAPLCFVTMLTIGAALDTTLGQHGLIVPQLEPLVAGSVLVLGVMLTHPAKLVMPAALAIIGVFAIFHGMAHGGELSAGSSVLAGIVIGSALLHAIGMTFAHFVLRNRPQLTLRLGQAVSVLGGGLILSAVI